MILPSKSSPCVGIRTCSDYSPFGVELDGRTVSGGYRYGFNGKEKTDETSGEGNSYDFGARMLDPRIGRWFMIDPMSDKQPDQSTYKSFLNCPLVFIDPDGKDDHLNSKEEVLKKYPDAKQINEKYFTVQRGIKSARQK